jgi:hypothetical protein
MTSEPLKKKRLLGHKFVVSSIWFCQIMSACLDKDKPQGETVTFLCHICSIVEQSGSRVSTSWMAVINGLYMLDKVSIFCPDILPTCVLFCSHNESIEHFFLVVDSCSRLRLLLSLDWVLISIPPPGFTPDILKQLWLHILRTTLMVLSLAIEKYPYNSSHPFAWSPYSCKSMNASISYICYQKAPLNKICLHSIHSQLFN